MSVTFLKAARAMLVRRIDLMSDLAENFAAMMEAAEQITKIDVAIKELEK